MIIGAAHFFNQRCDEAVPKLLRAIQESPSHPPPYRCLAACYAHMGRLDDARDIIAQLRAITPVVVPSIMLTATLSTAKFFCRACAWRPARRRSNDPPPLGSFP
jgi:hypothetical protein